MGLKKRNHVSFTVGSGVISRKDLTIVSLEGNVSEGTDSPALFSTIPEHVCLNFVEALFECDEDSDSSSTISWSLFYIRSSSAQRSMASSLYSPDPRNYETCGLKSGKCNSSQSCHRPLTLLLVTFTVAPQNRVHSNSDNLVS
jgi:hypothetical protein